MHRHAALFAILALLVTACSSGPEPQPETEVTEQPTEPVLEAPSVEALSDQPCGNPQWAQLPPESNEDGDPDHNQAPDLEVDPDEQSSDDASEPQSSATPLIKPCTESSG